MQVRSADVIVLGGGIAGLAAAGALSRRRVRVILIEARDRLGGRVWTCRKRGWPRPIEFGAQFVHAGNDPFWDLLKRHRIETAPVPGKHWRWEEQELTAVDATKRIAEVTERIDERRMRGWSFAEFLRRKARSVAEADRELAAGFVEGFEAAPMEEMSAIAVAGETLADDEQFQFPAGYDGVVDALRADLGSRDVTLKLKTPCHRIAWRPGAVRAVTRAGTFAAPTTIVTLPLGVLQASPLERGAVEFAPRLRSHTALAAKMGLGHVIRITLRLDGRRWGALLPRELRPARGGFGFIHSRLDGVPVWWSLSGEPILTGWAGGPAAQALAGRSAAGIHATALRSLAQILRVPTPKLGAAITAAAMHNWSRDPFARGAYSFTRAGHDGAAEQLRQPVKNTLFFAGEATADGEEVGTVHGALASGLRAAEEVARVLGA
jgi:monoamine oxidase